MYSYLKARGSASDFPCFQGIPNTCQSSYIDMGYCGEEESALRFQWFG